MLAILSPAKDMKMPNRSAIDESFLSRPQFIIEASLLVEQLRTFHLNDLAGLMSVSIKLAELNFFRFKNWNIDHKPENSSIAIQTYTGEAYRGLNASEFSNEMLGYSQKVLCILSGLYGTLRPLDLIQPYRLEIGSKILKVRNIDLYNFWREKITAFLNRAIAESPGDKVLLNLASKEYWQAIGFSGLDHPVLNVSFYEENEGKTRMVTVYAKKARGLFARFIIENKIEKQEDLRAFDSEGYFYDNSRSDSNNLVFVR